MSAWPKALHVRARTLEISTARPLLMGIVNASPESFSRDGRTDLARLVAHAEELVAEGADLIDVGGESGVTNAPPLDPLVEARRVVPLVEELVARGVTVSVDTWKAPVARAVLEAGAHLVNDVSGLRDPGLADACAEHRAGLVVMHTRAEPKVKAFPAYVDVVDDVIGFLAERIDAAVARGVATDLITVDPGPDFAKTPAQTVAVLRALDRLGVLGRPILLAVSRKDFVGALTHRDPRHRLAGTLAAVAAGVDAGAAILRVHDVAAVADFLAVRAALTNATPVPDELVLPEALMRQSA